MITVREATAETRESALQLLLGHQSASVRQARVAEVEESSRRGQLCLDGLLLAERDGEPAGAILYAIQPDGTAFVWPPAIGEQADADDVADALMQVVRCRTDGAGAWMAQCILEKSCHHARGMLERNGFPHLADLHYLEKLLGGPLPQPAGRDLDVLSFDPEINLECFAAVVERTYQGTLDCPGLSNARSGAQALESHQTAGEFDASRWKIYRAGGRDVGVLLMSEHAEQNAWEVVYMGVVPEARGRGYGRDMLICGLREARAAGRGSVMLAVDGRNKYARAVYDELGFAEIAVRVVHARLSESAGRLQ